MQLGQGLLYLFRRAYEHEQVLVAGLADADRVAVGTPEAWSARDLIAHLAAWKERMARNVAAASREEPVFAVGDYDRANAEIFAANCDRSWSEVLAYAAQAYKLLVEAVRALSDTALAEQEVLPWQKGRPLWRLLIGNGYSHPISHMAQYYVARGQVEQEGALWDAAAQDLLGLAVDSEYKGVAHYNLACYCALAGEAERAIEELGEALRLNPGLRDWSHQDPDLASLREHPAYQEFS